MKIRVDPSRSLRAGVVLAVLYACVWSLPLSIAAQEEDWVVTPSGSEVRIHVSRSGVFGFAAHNHEVVAPALSGTIRFDPQLIEQAVVELTFDATALTVTPTGEPPDDVPKVQATMLSDKVLDVERYRTIDFRSRRITVESRNAGQMRLRVAGDLTLHGVTRPIDGPVSLSLSADQLTGTGALVIKQSTFDIKPVSVGLGTVKVKDEVTINYTFAARREDAR
jgi:polyisoprenoid-binding protein YceI